MTKQLGAATLALTAVLACPIAAHAHGGGHGGGMHGGGFHGGGGGMHMGGGGMHMGGGGMRMGGGGFAAPRMAAPRMAAPAYHGGAATGFRGGMAGGARGGNMAGFSHGPSLNYSRGYSGMGAGARGMGGGGFRNATATHNFGMARQSAIGNRSLSGNAIGNRNIGGNTISNRNVVNNVGGVNNNLGGWHRGNWGGGYGGYGGYGRGMGGYGGYGGYGGLGYGGLGYGGLGYGGLGFGGFGTGLLFGLGSGLGFGLGYGLLGGGLGGFGGYGGYGGYGMGGYGGYGMGGYGGYGMGGYGGYGMGGYGSWPYAYGYSSYTNPYYTNTMGNGYLNYAQPIAVDPSAAAPAQATIDNAGSTFTAARDAFKSGDYASAQQKVEQALKELPNDVDLHEFRALTLFAQGRYSESAAALYAVLTSGPGWNWATMVGLYPSVDAFTTQLRALESYCSTNPNAAGARFVLAYLYITMGSTNEAASELRTVVHLQPDDRLSQQLLATVAPSGAGGAVTATGATAPVAGAAAPAAAPAEPTTPAPADLTGTWKAPGASGTSIELKLEGDGKFTWTTSGQGAPKSFSGKYTTGSGLLTMVASDGLAIVGRVSGSEHGGFHFKLIGGGPNDKGLTFTH